VVNKKHVRRLYLREGLKLRSKPRRKLVAMAPRERAVNPDTPNRRWSMDFMRDTLGNGRPFRTFNVLDDGSREALRIEVDFSLPAERVVQALEELAARRGYPDELVMDNGPEFVSRLLDAWAARHHVQLRFIRPGKPVENCFVESFNGTFRRDCLDAHWFEDLGHARRVIESWRIDYNQERPHSGLGDLEPAEFAALRSPAAPPPARRGLQTPDQTLS
jgi:putative transposase